MLESNKTKLILVTAILVVIFGGYFLYSFLTSRQAIEQAPVISQGFPESPLESKPLTQDKEDIKRQLTAPLGEAGILTDGPDFRIDYIAPDFFQVEIKSINIVDARDKAISWFKNKGFSEEDICRFPVTFYLNAEIVGKLEGSGVIFNTLPDFCQ